MFLVRITRNSVFFCADRWLIRFLLYYFFWFGLTSGSAMHYIVLEGTVAVIMVIILVEYEVVVQ